MAKDEYLEKVQRLINKAGYSEIISFEEVERGFAEGLEPFQVVQIWLDNYE